MYCINDCTQQHLKDACALNAKLDIVKKKCKQLKTNNAEVEKIIINNIKPWIQQYIESKTDDTIKPYVDAKVGYLIGNAPKGLDTFEELATALNNDPLLVKNLLQLLNQTRQEVYIAQNNVNNIDQRLFNMHEVVGDVLVLN